jgi:hypothetical protein
MRIYEVLSDHMNADKNLFLNSGFLPKVSY